MRRSVAVRKLRVVMDADVCQRRRDVGFEVIEAHDPQVRRHGSAQVKIRPSLPQLIGYRLLAIGYRLSAIGDGRGSYSPGWTQLPLPLPHARDEALTDSR